MLNPRLCNALARICHGDVRVVDAGKDLAGYYEDDLTAPPVPGPPGEPPRPRRRLRILARGESYLCNCPFCGDERQRMSVNHRFAELDPETGYYGSELWKCYNLECQNDRDHRRSLLRDVRDLYDLPGLDVGGRPGRIRVVDHRHLEPCDFPGILVPIDQVAPDNKAAAYLAGRRFDLAELAGVWGVGYASYVPPRERGSMAMGRIIAPVTVDGIMVGYQARFPEDLDWRTAGFPKYLTYFPKSMTVYGLDLAAASPVVVLCEGVTDAWRYGPGAASLLGRDASPRQVELLVAALRGRPLVVAPDRDDPLSLPEFTETAYNIVRAGHTGPVSVLVLTEGCDPADLDRDTFHSAVAAAAADPLWPPR